jgi:dTDP-4-dehydrorhamnose reductase
LSRKEETVSGYDFPDIDITSHESVSALVAAEQPDILINCAAFNDVDGAEQNCELAEKVNATAPRLLADICSENKVKFVHFSSDFIFDGQKGNFYLEDDEPSPLSAYGKTKQMGEEAVRSSDANFLMFRLTLLMGGGPTCFYKKLWEWADTYPVLKLVYDQITSPSYSFDVVRYMLQALERGLSGLYNYGNPDYASKYEMARFLLKNSDYEDTIVLPASSNDFSGYVSRPFFSPLDTTKLCNDLCIDYLPSWQDATLRYIEIFKK